MKLFASLSVVAVCVVAGLTQSVQAGAPASSSIPQTAAVKAVSENGLIRRAQPKTLNLGEAFEVMVTMPTQAIEVVGANSSLWGSGPYMGLSNVATAAVHAGIVRIGERGWINVINLPGQATYPGLQRNGVGGWGYGAWTSSFNVERADPPKNPKWAMPIGAASLKWGADSRLPWAKKEQPCEAGEPPFRSCVDQRGIPNYTGVPIVPTGKPQAFTVGAPWHQPGRYDLRLFNGPTLVDVLEVVVVAAESPDALTLSKATFSTGEVINATVKFPNNRYLSGAGRGPEIALIPVELAGRRLTSAQQTRWLQDCQSCKAGLLAMVQDPRTTKGFDNVLRAPAQPGRYEVRLYDRGTRLYTDDAISTALPRDPGDGSSTWSVGPTPETTWTWAGIKDYYLAAREIVVSAPGTTPNVLRFVRPKDAQLKDVEELKELIYDDPFFIEAIFEKISGVTLPKERTVTLEWVDKGMKQQRVISMTCTDERCISVPVKLGRPNQGGGL